MRLKCKDKISKKTYFCHRIDFDDCGEIVQVLGCTKHKIVGVCFIDKCFNWLWLNNNKEEKIWNQFDLRYKIYQDNGK